MVRVLKIENKILNHYLIISYNPPMKHAAWKGIRHSNKISNIVAVKFFTKSVAKRWFLSKKSILLILHIHMNQWSMKYFLL